MDTSQDGTGPKSASVAGLSIDEWQDVLSDLCAPSSGTASLRGDAGTESGRGPREHAASGRGPRDHEEATHVLVASDPEITPPQSEPTGETLHLRRIIETQPACLLRAGIDGLLLAANEAALRLLGAEELRQVLGSNVTERIIPHDHGQWVTFAARVRDGAPGSMECELADLSGVRRTVLLQAVPLLDHPDGVPSMILAVRDTSAPRRLETALQEAEVRRQLDDLRTELEQALAERERLAAVPDEREVDHRRQAAEHAAERARLEQTLAEEHQLALFVKEREGRHLQDGLRTQLEEALAERQRLAAVLDERDVDHRRLVGEHAAERARLEQTLAEERQLALLVKEREGRHLQDGLRTQLDEALADRQRLATALDERDVDHQRLVAKHAAERSQTEQALAAATLKEERTKKALADHCVELQALDETARNLEMLAAAGRMAIEVGRELQTVVAAVDARAQHLLTECSMEAAHRPVVEALRGDAISAASLARQITQVNAKGPTT